MTDPTLSPAAQAVLDATYREMDYAPRRHVQWAAAAALRAAADQVVPEGGVFLSTASAARIRAQFLAIAAELAGTPTTPAES
jgi:hypothetical protein